MNKTFSINERRRRLFAFVMLTVFIMWLPLEVFASSCCCSSTVASASVTINSSCPEAMANKQEATVACHTVPPVKTEVEVSPSSCCSSNKETKGHSLQSAEGTSCQAACNSIKLSSTTESAIPGIEQRFLSIQQTHVLLNPDIIDHIISRSPLSEIPPDIPPPLFLLNNTFLI